MNNDEILELNKKCEIKGEIYQITCNISQKSYIGQTVSHRKNKGKYRPFGSLGRFKDHISEATNNTKKKQCTYLNNAIRKYGENQFEYKLIEQCDISKLNELEIMYIDKYNTLCPNGYNLTKGGNCGNCGSYIKVKNNTILKEKKTRGRDHGYTHKKSTRKLMSKRLKKICESPIVKNRMSDTMREYYDKKKIITLAKYELDDDIEKYIHPVKNKNTGKVHKYIIKINGKKYGFSSVLKDDTLNDVYIRAKTILEKAVIYKKNSKNSKNSKISERKIDNQQSDT